MSEPDELETSGVEQLIQRLRAEGVNEGQQQAERIVREAETRARWIVQQASDEADAIRAKAREEADRFAAAARQALDIACRDALLQLKSQLANLFHEELKRDVSESFDKESVLTGIVLALAGRLGEATADTPRGIELPEQAVDLEALRRDPEHLAGGPLTDLARRLSHDMLSAGILLDTAEGLSRGVRLSLQDDQIQIDFTDAAVTELLLKHLQPRFRALMEGIVK